MAQCRVWDPAFFAALQPRLAVMLSNTELLTAVGIAFAVLVCIHGLHDRRKTRYPPGPAGLPLVGNVLQLPKEYHERKFQEWGREYGGFATSPILSLCSSADRLYIRRRNRK